MYVCEAHDTFLYSRFKAVSQRPNLKLLIHESTMDIFRKYTDELEEVQSIYEANKVTNLQGLYGAKV